MSDNRLTHDERLRGEIRVNELFLSGESFIAYPYRIVYKTGNSARPVSSGLQNRKLCKTRIFGHIGKYSQETFQTGRKTQ